MRLLKISLLLAFVFCGTYFSKAQTPVSKREKAAIEKIVREYLLKNPALIREAMQALEVQDAKEKQLRSAASMTNLKSEIYSDPTSPVGGNPNGDVTIVVFFDYNCGYCKKTLPELQGIVAKDPSLRVIYKEFPILGPQSQTAAQAAMAAARQGKYVEFHNALIAADGAGEDVIKNISHKLGIDYAKLQKDMIDLKLNQALDANLKLAEALDIQGTPAYIVGDQIIPGAIDADALGRLVGEQRAKLTVGKSPSTTGEPKK
ncbi:MAG: DsbA family protein [Pyrinomonadaceae bacterium]